MGTRQFGCPWPHPAISVYICRLSLSYASYLKGFSTLADRVTLSRLIMFLTFLLTPYSLLLLPLAFYLLPYLRSNAIRDIPGPLFAAFSNFWLLYHCRRGKRFVAVDAAHKKYGKLVRIQPNHISVADPEAIPIIYSHGGGWLKRCVPCASSSIPCGVCILNRVQRLLRCLSLHSSWSLQHSTSP